MKRHVSVLICLLLGVAPINHRGMAACPEDANDSGECDTLYTEIYPPDQLFEGFPPHFVRFPIHVTHDVPNPYIDSIAAIALAFDYEFSNPTTYCSLSNYWNNVDLYPSPTVDRSVFRHFIEDGDTVVHNWMMDLSQKGMGLVWDTRILDLSDQHFWFAIFPTGSQDQLFGEGSRILLATMTFKLEDTTTVCIDTGFWPPASRTNCFSRSDAVTYLPRHFFPVCELLGLGAPPQVYCPDDKEHHTNGQFLATGFSARAYSKVIQSLDAEFIGSGIGVVWFENVVGMGTDRVEGEVVYQVSDHCEPGGTITLTAIDDAGARADCDFQVTLFNTTPELVLPDTVRALSGHVLVLDIYAEDVDEDEVVSFLQSFWYVPDSLRPPSYYPSCVPGNPGHLTWQATQADTGIWIFSFLAADACVAVDTQQVTIRVGIPFCGDCSENGLIDPGDVIFLMNYLFRQGASPEPLCRGDGNCNDDVDVGDVVLLINYLYKGGVLPCFECCQGMSAR
jgi:hypothetical protein